MDKRTVSTKVYSLCLLLQVIFALSHACIKHDKHNYAKVILKSSFHWHRCNSPKLWTNNLCFKIVYSFGYVMSTKSVTGIKQFVRQKVLKGVKRSKSRKMTWQKDERKRSTTCETRYPWTTRDARKERTTESHLSFIYHHTLMMKVTS
jgi:hypothetical protein